MAVPAPIRVSQVLQSQLAEAAVRLSVKAGRVKRNVRKCVAETKADTPNRRFLFWIGQEAALFALVELAFALA